MDQKFLKFQIIKRLYIRFEAILLYFDLDYSAVDCTNINNNYSIYLSDRYIMSLLYKRQSTSYNQILYKYAKHGFYIFLHQISLLL